jgi:hypothetical protein
MKTINIIVSLIVPEGQPNELLAEEYSDIVEDAVIKVHEAGKLPCVAAVEACPEVDLE